MVDVIVGGIVGTIIISAVAYIRHQKKKGVKCIGCEAGSTCPHKANGNGCHCHDKSELNN